MRREEPEPTCNHAHETPTTMEEMKPNPRKLKNNMAADESEMFAEMWKWDIDYMADILCPFSHEIWEGARVPESLRRALMVYLYKKGASEDTGNHRGIQLLDIGGKVFTGILDQRPKKLTESKQLGGEYGFTSRLCTVGATFTLQGIVRQSRKVNEEGEWQGV